MDVKLTIRNRQKQIAELEEWREKAYHSAKLYKQRTKRWCDHQIKQKEFKEGDKVLLFNSKVSSSVKENFGVSGKDRIPSSPRHHMA